MKEGYFEQLLREIMLENPHKCQVILEPSETLGEERREAEAARLKKEQDAWTAEDLTKVTEAQGALDAWQGSEDDPADLAKLPHLTLEDMDDTPEDIPTTVSEKDGVTILRHEIPSGDVRYVNMYFEVDARDADTLHEMSFLAELLGTLPAADMDGRALITEQQKTLGRLDFDLSPYGKNNSTEISSIQFVTSFSVLEQKAMAGADLVTKILTQTHFDEHDMISDILKQCRQERLQGFIMAGHSAAIKRVMAMNIDTAAAQDEITGTGYYKWLASQVDAGDAAALQPILESAMQRVLAGKLTVSVTCGAEYDAAPLVDRLASGVKSAGASSAQDIDSVGDSDAEPVGATGIKSEGIVIPADIAFTARAGSLLEAGQGFSGKMQVAARIVSLAYLWNVIRVQGGAYGTGISVHPSGTIACYSYRDPDGTSSLETFKTCGDFLRQAASGDFDLTGFIIGAVSDASPLLTPRLKAQIGDGFYFRGLTWEDRCRTRKELLSVTKEDLVELAEAIEAALDAGGTCIVSSKEQIEKAAPGDVLSI